VTTLEAQALKLVAGLVRVAVMAPSDTAEEPAAPVHPVQRQVMLLLSRRDREYRLSALAAELGASVPATMAILSPLIGDGLVEMRPAPSFASHDMRVAATDQGLALIPAPANWADALIAQVDQYDPVTQEQLLRLVTTQITDLQRTGSIPINHMCLSCRFFEGYRHPGTDNPHHCWFVDAPFGYRELRLHCPDHVTRTGAPPSGTS
jgi:DNA-binding MarR family transcriptional regulator